MRISSFALSALVLTSTLTFADLKIKTRTTVMGHTTESTVYIKGPRQRTEMSFGGRAASVSIMQCDQKKMITVSGNQCMVIPFGSNGETSCPVMPNVAAMAREAMGGEPEMPRKGGVLTISRTSSDTGERQEMFGYKARHIKSTMVMESSPDACNQSHMKMEMDGWYADLSAGFSCGDESYRTLACGAGGKHGCSDRIVMKGSGGGALGFPLKQTMTMTSEQGINTMTTEVVELTNTSLDAPLFEMPNGCQVMDMSALMGNAPAPAAPPAAKAAPEPTPAAAPAPAPTPTLAPKGAGVIRIGVVKIKDNTGQGLPTENLILNLMSEFARNQMEPVALDADAPHSDVESEAREKQCDYIVYTASKNVAEPGSGLAASVIPKGLKLDPAKYQALSGVTLYKVGKPLPELKDLPLAAEGERFGVDAVTATFIQESDKVAEQIHEDLHPKAAKPKAPVKPAASKPKPK
ncbi:MAG: hypothetical protein ACXVZV_05660 [Terriglobales bacterium]